MKVDKYDVWNVPYIIDINLGVLEVLCQSDRILNSKGLTHERTVRFK